ncbi:helix-turn-helix domain-containing protein [Bacillus smithii]|uniref:helix-turn-helix domain-containing protein n=1 Tax=Bacillus smithii TaxID=1479 RepID=UPI002E1BA442|nr:LuxR C-terminal-related transcriptional regulator [Bacillus smithii]MED4928764.1 LuxR C-terminal-related transcriptional regulator [Bacillus smithii]
MKDREFSHKPLLTKREKEVFELLVQDKTTKEIAKELFISEKTVRNHISNVIRINCKKAKVIATAFAMYKSRFYCH